MLLQIAHVIVDDDNIRNAAVIGLVWLLVTLYKLAFKLEEGEAVPEKIMMATMAAAVLALAVEYIQSVEVADESFNIMDVISQVLVVILGSTGLARFGKRVKDAKKTKKAKKTD